MNIESKFKLNDAFDNFNQLSLAAIKGSDPNSKGFEDALKAA